MRKKYIWDGKKWVEKPSRLAHRWHSVIDDSMDSLVCHADGVRYESKSAFRNAVRAAGCEEVGNDVRRVIPPRVRHYPGLRDVIARVLE